MFKSGLSLVYVWFITKSWKRKWLSLWPHATYRCWPFFFSNRKESQPFSFSHTVLSLTGRDGPAYTYTCEFTICTRTYVSPILNCVHAQSMLAYPMGVISILRGGKRARAQAGCAERRYLCARGGGDHVMNERHSYARKITDRMCARAGAHSSALKRAMEDIGDISTTCIAFISISILGRGVCMQLESRVSESNFLPEAFMWKFSSYFRGGWLSMSLNVNVVFEKGA